MKSPEMAREFFVENPGELTPQERSAFIPLRRGDFTEYAAGAGIHDTGPFTEPEVEKSQATKILVLMQAKGIETSCIAVDDLICDPTGISLVERICDIGKAHGVRTPNGNPRGVIITGFTQSRYITAESLEQLKTLALRQDDRGKILKEEAKMLMLSRNKREALEQLPVEHRRLIAGTLLYFRYTLGDWQELAGRKNTRRESIITITVGPHEIYETLLALQTGTTHPLGATSDMLFRWKEFMANYA